MLINCNKLLKNKNCLYMSYIITKKNYCKIIKKKPELQKKIKTCFQTYINKRFGVLIDTKLDFNCHVDKINNLQACRVLGYIFKDGIATSTMLTRWFIC